MVSPLPTDFSCGVIPWRSTEHGREYLLIQHNAGHWAFPKGHPEEGETEVETARRELEEETGIKHVRVQAEPFFDESYIFDKRGRGPTHKTVRYFLGEVWGGELQLQEEEVQAAAWAGAELTRARITFEEGKKLLDLAEDYLEGRPGF